MEYGIKIFNFDESYKNELIIINTNISDTTKLKRLYVQLYN